MRVVLLTGLRTEHAFVANKLGAEIALSAILIDRGKKRTTMERVKSLCKRYTAMQLASRCVGKIIAAALRDEERRKREFCRILGDDNCVFRSGEVPFLYVDGINTKESIKKVRELNPDALLVYGTGIVGRTILGIPPRGTLNLHTGISPYYRGADCAFWPLYNNEPHMIGATVHECTPVIDGGMIYATRRAELAEDDNLFSMFPQSVKAGAELYAEVVKRFIESGSLEGTKQDLSLGKEFRAAMKCWWKELIVRRRIRKGLIRDFVKANALNAMERSKRC